MALDGLVGDRGTTVLLPPENQYAVEQNNWHTFGFKIPTVKSLTRGLN